MTTTEIMDPQRLEREVQETIHNYKDLVISDDGSFVAAQEALKVLKGRERKINEFFDPTIKKAHELHKETLANKKKLSGPVMECYNAIAGRCGQYQHQKEMEARRIQEEKEREERKRREAEMERLRKEEEDRRLAEAAELEAQGKKEEAEKVIDEPVHIPEPEPMAPAPIERPPQVENVSYRTYWKWRLKDITKVPRAYLMLDEIKINKIVSAMKGDNDIEGIEIFCEKKPVTR